MSQQEEKGSIIRKTLSDISETARQTVAGIGEGLVGGTQVLFTGKEDEPRHVLQSESITQHRLQEAAQKSKNRVEEFAASTKHAVEEAGDQARFAYPNYDPLASTKKKN